MVVEMFLAMVEKCLFWPKLLDDVVVVVVVVSKRDDMDATIGLRRERSRRETEIDLDMLNAIVNQ